MARWMVTLVGHQPMPVYSLIREPELRPDLVIFVASESTSNVVNRIRALLNDIPSEMCIVQPYSIDDVITKLHAELAAVSPDDTVIFNLTGGTKTMVFGAMEVARRREAEIVYLKSETDTQVFRYRVSPSGIEEIEPVNATQPVPLDDFLAIHIGRFDEGKRELTANRTGAGSLSAKCRPHCRDLRSLMKRSS
ncbi:MAG: hypothetical protein KatS3mg059_1334 [Thermomicrobiales bacterium]|nr:MAG: hypothetical protein KatS3mg059_1334 [Thermomicrobiales bacterium]